jgi:hypothetical protein
MMFDAQIDCVGESTTYRVFSEADRLSVVERFAAYSGEYHLSPTASNQP